MFSRRWVSRIAAAAAGAMLLVMAQAGQASTEHALAVTGTGGSTAARVLAQWNFLFAKETRINVHYASAHSAVGIREAIARSVDFGCTEIPLSVEELNKNDLIQFPLLIGGVVVAVNLPGVEPGALRLSPGLLSKIYLGEIKVWNDAEIRAENAALNLPRLPIKPVVRGTPASTSLALTTYLSKTDRNWATRVGASSQPAWLASAQRVGGVQAMGQAVQSTPGAIGYLNFDEALRNRLAVVQLRNQAGYYVKPSHASILAASDGAGLSGAERIPSLINVEGASSWPIVEVTYILLDRRPKSPQRARSTLKFFFWAFLQGDQMAAETGFVPLPALTQARVVGRFRDVLAPDKSPIDFLK
jgi:phosphate transport system substrate-binding protein